MNLFTPAETVENYAAAGVAKTQAPAWRLLLLGILAGFLIAMGGAVIQYRRTQYRQCGAVPAGLRIALPLWSCYGDPHRRPSFLPETRSFFSLY